MAKYSYEFKKKIVDAYLRGEGSYEYLSSVYGPQKSAIEKWVKNYQSFGDEGLMRSRQQKKYSFEKKLSVVELYLTNEISYQDLAIQEGITNPSLIAAWVSRFRIAGPDALRPHKKGRKKTLDNHKTDNKSKETEERIIATSAEHVKELEDEAKMRERRSSSTVSEESSH